MHGHDRTRTDPEARLEHQAERVRRIWRGLSPSERERLYDRLGQAKLDRAWRDVFDGQHALRAWLDGDAPWPPPPMQPSARELITSHPLAGRTPWSSPRT